MVKTDHGSAQVKWKVIGEIEMKMGMVMCYSGIIGILLGIVLLVVLTQAFAKQRKNLKKKLDINEEK